MSARHGSLRTVCLGLLLALGMAACTLGRVGALRTPQPGPSPSPSPSPAPVPVPSAGARSGVDRPDDAPGDQVHAMYVLPAGGTDRHMDTNGQIANSFSAFEGWLTSQMDGTQLRLDTYQGRLDITYVQLAETDATIAAQGVYVRDFVEKELHALGFNDTRKIYAVYYDGSSTAGCGAGPWAPHLSGDVGIEYLQGTSGLVQCSGNIVGESPVTPHYFDFAMLHEIMHTLGMVPACAPHQTQGGHVSDSPTDLMYAGPLPWRPAVLDLNHDDYYRANIPGCLDLTTSAFLDPSPGDALPPPGWPSGPTWPD